MNSGASFRIARGSCYGILGIFSPLIVGGRHVVLGFVLGSILAVCGAALIIHGVRAPGK